MDNRKETERSELHRTIWNIANDLRGSVDGWDFKQYVLGMLFHRYISENLSEFINRGEAEAGNPDFSEFSRDIVENYKLQRLKSGSFDEVLDFDAIKDYCHKKGIL